MILRHIKRYVPCKARADYDPTHHHHVIEVADMATGIPLVSGYPVTAFKFRCRLCGHEIVDICEYGIEQLQAGHSTEDVFQWMGEDAGAVSAG